MKTLKSINPWREPKLWTAKVEPNYLPVHDEANTNPFSSYHHVIPKIIQLCPLDATTHAHCSSSNCTEEKSLAWPGCWLSHRANGSSCRETRRWVSARSARPGGQLVHPGTWWVKEGGFCCALPGPGPPAFKSPENLPWLQPVAFCPMGSSPWKHTGAHIPLPFLETPVRPAGAVYRKLHHTTTVHSQ